MHTLVLGLDAFDPDVFERLSEQGRMPNLTRYVERNGYARFRVATPPQSEVSWTSIATGANPGRHGIFDFVHRNAATYAVNVSLLPTESGFFGTRFVPPTNARTIFDAVVDRGYPATVLWWPATFPARPESPVRTLPGLGTPDVRGRLGVGTEFGVDIHNSGSRRKTPLEPLEPRGTDRYSGRLTGPARKKGDGASASTLPFQLEVTGEHSAQLAIGEHKTDLRVGTWSPILDLTFNVGLFARVPALTRVILTQTHPTVRLYFLPLQLHPLHSPWRYGTPGGFVKSVWSKCGPFLTLGWPQDTAALEDECITDEQFLDLCTSIAETRERILMHQLQTFDEGMLALVFDTLDRVQHMFWRDRPDIVEAWYERLDALVGRTERRLAASVGDDVTIVIVSDHGFADFDYKVHLNRWLIDHGYLHPDEAGTNGDLQSADWSRSRAYAVGLNSLYLNVAGREGEGCVRPDEYDALAHSLRDELLQWQGPDGRAVVQNVWHQDEAFDGPLASYGPDLIVGYAPGYRGSAQTGLGRWEAESIEANRDHWGADHCIDPAAVPGVLFANRDLSSVPHPSYRDVPALTLGEPIDEDNGAAPPPSFSTEDKAVLEERLKSLGYL